MITHPATRPTGRTRPVRLDWATLDRRTIDRLVALPVGHPSAGADLDTLDRVTGTATYTPDDCDDAIDSAWAARRARR